MKIIIKATFPDEIQVQVESVVFDSYPEEIEGAYSVLRLAKLRIESHDRKRHEAKAEVGETMAT